MRFQFKSIKITVLQIELEKKITRNLIVLSVDSLLPNRSCPQMQYGIWTWIACKPSEPSLIAIIVQKPVQTSADRWNNLLQLIEQHKQNVQFIYWKHSSRYRYSMRYQFYEVFINTVCIRKRSLNKARFMKSNKLV